MVGEIPVKKRPGFTLLEMLTTVAALVIVLGLMVSLARHVRDASAQELTKDLLRRLDALMDRYEQHHHQLPAIARFIAPTENDPDERQLQIRALENNRQMLAILKEEAGSASNAFGGLPDSVYDESTIRDAWGTPIVYMPAMHPLIGTAPRNRRFFFSAGPDGLFLTQQDNLYSYEDSAAGQPAGQGE